MKNFTRRERENGELALRNLSEKAFWLYSVTDPVTVWEIEKDIEDDEGECFETVKTYAIDFGGDFREDMSFKELEEFLEELADDLLELESRENED